MYGHACVAHVHAEDNHVGAVRVQPTQHGGRRLHGEASGGHLPHARPEHTRELLVVADAPAEVYVQTRTSADGLDDLEIHHAAGLGAVEVHEVEVRVPAGLEVARHGERVGGVRGLRRVVAAGEPHDFAADDVDGRDDRHVRKPSATRLPRTPDLEAHPARRRREDFPAALGERDVGVRPQALVDAPHHAAALVGGYEVDAGGVVGHEF